MDRNDKLLLSSCAGREGCWRAPDYVVQYDNSISHPSLLSNVAAVASVETKGVERVVLASPFFELTDRTIGLAGDTSVKMEGRSDRVVALPRRLTSGHTTKGLGVRTWITYGGHGHQTAQGAGHASTDASTPNASP
jgi:hypothetical protein